MIYKESFEFIVNIIVTIAFITIGLHFTYTKLFKGKKSKSVPGIGSSDPKLGNFPDIKKAGSLHEFLVQLHKVHGPIASFYWLTTKVISICEHRAFKDVVNLFDRPGLIFENWKEILGEDNLQYCNGVEGKDRRRVYERSFSDASVATYIGKLSAIGDCYIMRIKNKRNAVDIDDVTFSMSADGVVKCCFCPDNDEDSSKVTHLYKDFSSIIERKLIEGKNLSEELVNDSPFRKQKNEFVNYIRKIISKRITYLNENEVNDSDSLLLDKMIMFHGDINKSVVEMDSIVMVIGGFHTTGNALTFAFYQLAKHPEIQEKLYKAICESPLYSYLSKTNDPLKSTSEMSGFIRDIEYLRAVIDEALRCAKIAPYMARYSSETINVGQYTVPADTPIIGALGVSLDDNKVFPDPDKFSPDRFMGENRRQLPPLAFVPFGFAGKRKCPAEKFSYMEMSIWLAKFVINFRWELDTKSSGDAEEFKSVYGLVTHLNESVILKFTDRKS